MNHSPEIDKIARALVKYQLGAQNPAKTATNPHFDSQYATLPDILAEARATLAPLGVSVHQSAGTNEAGRTGVSTLLLHDSGQWIESDTIYLPITQPGGKQADTAQGAGSAITYACRYSLCAMLGIAACEDDDGNRASKSTVDVEDLCDRLLKGDEGAQEESRSFLETNQDAEVGAKVRAARKEGKRRGKSKQN